MTMRENPGRSTAGRQPVEQAADRRGAQVVHDRLADQVVQARHADQDRAAVPADGADHVGGVEAMRHDDARAGVERTDEAAHQRQDVVRRQQGEDAAFRV
jgi:hypothetical protein